MGLASDLFAEPTTPQTPEGGVPLPTSKPVAVSARNLFEQADQQDQNKLKFVVDQSMDQTPERAARALQIQQKTGIPKKFIDDNFEELNKASEAADFNSQQFLKNSPTAAQWLLENPDYAPILRDDAGRLGTIETTLNSLKQGYHLAQQSRAASQASGAYQEIEAFTKIKDREHSGLNPVLDPELRDVPLVLREMAPEQRAARMAYLQEHVIERGAAIVAAGQTADAIQQSPQVAAAHSDGTLATWWKYFSKNPVNYIVQIGAQSVPQMAPGLVLGAAGLGPVGFGIGSYTSDFGNSLVDSLRNQGVDVTDTGSVQQALTDKEMMKTAIDQATKHAAPVALFDTLSAGLAGRVLAPARYAAKPLLREGINLAVQAPAQGALGAAGEATGQLAQGKELNAADIMAEFVGEFVGTPAEVAGMAIHRGNVRIQEMIAAKEREALFTSLSQGIADSKTFQRLPEKMQELVTKMTKDGPIENVSVPIEQWNEYFQSKSLDPRAIATGLLGNSQVYEEAIRTGADLRIPTATYATGLAATEHGEALAKDLRFGADQLTGREAETLLKEMKAEAQKSKSERQSTAEQVRESIVTQLTQAGQERSSAEAYATLHESLFRTLGTKAGLDPMTLFGQYGLKIDRPLPASLQQEAKGQTLDVLLDRLRTNQQPSKEELSKEGASSYHDIKAAMEQVKKTLDARGLDISKLDNATLKKELLAQPTEKGTELFQTAQTLEAYLAQKATERSAKIKDAGLVVALRDGNKIYGGKPGEGHAHLLMQHPSVPNTTETGYADNTGKFYTRAQAMEEFSVVDSNQIRKELFQSKVDQTKTPEFKFDPNSQNILEQRRDGGKRGAIRFGKDRKFTIELFQKADLSTFLHESGHFFLEVFGDVAEGLLAADPSTLTSEQQLVLKDYEAARKWLGVKPGEALTTKQHEKWARGFEAYLMEGKAPSAELRSAFAKFRAWLVSIYRAIKHLDISLNEDVRGVMDRLLATEEEIDTAEREAELLPVFTDAIDAGMNETEFAAYRKTVQTANVQAKEKLQQQLMHDIRREQEKWWKDARKTMRDGVEAEINQQPGYIAESLLRTGQLPDGSVPDGFQAIKLNRQAVADAFGEEAVKRLKGLTAVDGTDLSLAAETLGFASAEDLVNTLSSLHPKNQVIDADTDMRMRREYGDMLLDGTAVTAAEKAVLEDGRSQIIVAEIRALKKKAAQVKPFVLAERKKQLEARRQGLAAMTAPIASQAALRQMADGLISQKRVRDITSTPYLMAVRRAAKAAVLAAAKDDYHGAVIEKQRELLNLELYRAAETRLERIEKGREYLNKFDKASTRKNLRGEFVDQIDGLLARFDLRRRSLKSIDAQKVSLSTWVQTEAERLSAVVPALPGFVLDESYQRHYKDLAAEEFQGIVDSVKQLEKLARRENEQYLALRQMNFEQERSAILDRIKQFHPKAFDEAGKPMPIEPDFVPSISKAAKTLGDKFAGEFLNAETILHLLEGGEFGQVEQSLFGRLSDRSNWKASRLEGIYKKLKPLFKQYSLIEKAKFARQDIGESINLPITRENAVVTALLYGNQEGRERLMNYGWSDARIQQIIGLLDQRDMNLVDGIWKLFDEDLWPELKALNERTQGKAPSKVEPMPYPTKHGEARGGYFRLKYNTDLDERAHQFDESQAVKDMLGGSMGMVAKTNQGTSQERAKGVKLRPRLDLGVFAETVNETVHDLSYREAVADTMRLLNDKDMQNAIKSAAGVPAYRALVNRVREVAAPPRNPSGFIEKTLSIARKNTVVTILSGTRTALVNLTGVVPAFTRVNAGLLLREIAKFYNPLKMADMYRFATERSEYMKHRFNTFDRDLQDMAGKLTVNGKLLPETSQLLWLMGMTDRGVAVPVWNAAFAEGMKEHQNEVKLATEYADHVVRQTQGSGRDVDVSQIMSGHGGYGQLKKVFTMFYSYFNAQLGQLVRAGAISKREAQTNPAEAVVKFTARFMAIVVIPAVLSTIGGRDDDDFNEKNWFKKLVYVTAMYGAGMFPLVRDLSSYTWAQFDKSVANYGFKISPIQSAGEGLVKAAVSVRDFFAGDADQRDAKNMIMGASYLFGLPGKLISDTVLGFNAWMQGDAGPSAILFGPPKK